MLHTIKRNIIQHHQKQQCMRYIIPYIQQTYITTTSNTKQHHQQEGPIPSIYTNIKENAISSQNVLLQNQREKQIKQVQNNYSTKQNKVDVLIIGGGATGSGAALDATTRNLSTVLIERSDFGNETSSRSTKLIWAGIRYIGTATGELLRMKNITQPIKAFKEFWSEFKMVINCHKERNFLLKTQKHLTHWMPIAVPIKSWFISPPPMNHPLFGLLPLLLPFVMKFYDSLGKFQCPPSHVIFKNRAKRKFPQLDNDNFKYVQCFYEGMHNDARTCLSIALTAIQHGAICLNYVKMLDVLYDDDWEEEETNHNNSNNDNNNNNKHAIGIKCIDTLTNIEFNIYAKSIIFAGGPFTDELRLKEDPNAKPAVNGAAGTHIILPGYYINDIGLLDINTSDGRFLFFLPWLGSTLVGTTDRKGKPVSTPRPPEEEIQWMLREVEKYLSNDLIVRRSDVLSAWQGFRPLASDPHAAADAPISRDHVISTNPVTNITFITGGKWTTYREMAEDVIDAVVKNNQDKFTQPLNKCNTLNIPLIGGGEQYTNNTPIKLIQKFGVSEETAKHLANTYGTKAFDVCYLSKPSGKSWPRFGKTLVEGYPYIESEVEYQCKYENARTIADFLCLRTRLAYLNVDAAKQAINRVGDLMSIYLEWNDQELLIQKEMAYHKLNEFAGPVPINEIHNVDNQNDGDDDLHTAIGATTKHDLKRIFKILDIDNNGYIDIKEMYQAANMLGIDVETIPYIITDATTSTTSDDKNKQDEMKNELKDIFNIMDINNTGRINEEEFINWWLNTKDDIILKNQIKTKFNVNVGDVEKGPGVMFG